VAFKVQTIIFSKEAGWTEARAVEWAREHDFHAGKVDETETSFRLRQFDPSECTPGTFRAFPIEGAKGVTATGCRVPEEKSKGLEKFHFGVRPEDLSGADLQAVHDLLHENLYDLRRGRTDVDRDYDLDDLVNYHALTIAEMARRGMAHTIQDDLDRAVPELLDDDEDEEDTEKAGTAFGSPAGKTQVAKRIVSMIPDHKRYIEPFCGAAAVFFAKARSREEILCDEDVEIIEALRFLQSMKSSELDSLRKMDWECTREKFAGVLAMKPGDRIERFYRFKYLARFSFCSNRKSCATDELGNVFKNFGRLEGAGKRLEGADLIVGDGVDLMTRHADRDTFLFLDPPYWNTPNSEVGADHFPTARFKKALADCPGKWLLTLMTPEAKEIRWTPLRKRIYYRHRSAKGWKGAGVERGEWLLGNFRPHEKRDTVKDLSGQGATQVLASALPALGEVLKSDAPAFIVIPLERGTTSKAFSTNDFRVLAQTWKGSDERVYHLAIRSDPIAWWTLDLDPLHAEKLSGSLRAEPEGHFWDIEGEIASGSRLNPTKETPSFVERLDSGEVVVRKDDGLTSYEFRGSRMRGQWIASQRSDGTWTLERSTEDRNGEGGNGRTRD